MSSKSSLDFLRRILNTWVEWLDRVERRPARSKKTRWYQLEYHVPPFVVAILSSLFLFGLLGWDSKYNLYQLTALGFFVVLLVSLIGFYLHRDHPKLAKSDDATSLLGVLVIITVFWIKLVTILSHEWNWLTPYATPVSIGPLLIALLLHPRLAIFVSFTMALIFGLVNNFSLELGLMGAIGSISLVTFGYRSRTTHHIFRAGVVSGFIQVGIVLFLAMINEWDHQSTWVNMCSALVSGIFSACFCLGALPFFEGFFSRTSQLRLLELADVNHPLLRKMSIEAPGTYHHSMIVANLAAEAATAIGANSLLARAGAYFHDIGKMVKAEYFIENQGTFGNPHDEVNPSLSKLVITSHVKEGLALGKSYGLDQQVLEFIPQHHGTSQIEYFYQKALKMEEKEDDVDKEEVQEETFRYPGPRPQTKEAGIVMLADSIEAASRVLEEPNHQRYKDLVHKIINKKMSDHQLDETPLTLKDLHSISERFISTLVSINHARVPYPEDETQDKEGRIFPQ